MNIKIVARFGTNIPSSRSTIYQVQYQLPLVNYLFTRFTVCRRLHCWCELCI